MCRAALHAALRLPAREFRIREAIPSTPPAAALPSAPATAITGLSWVRLAAFPISLDLLGRPFGGRFRLYGWERGRGGCGGSSLRHSNLVSRFRNRLVGGNVFHVFRILQFHKVGNVKEGVALQPNIHKRGLHPGKDPGNTSFIDRSSKGVFVFAFEVDFSH